VSIKNARAASRVCGEEHGRRLSKDASRLALNRAIPASRRQTIAKLLQRKT
jgi:hypothetical protein